MKYGICHLSIVPCRIEPTDTSEMVTQLLFGETIKVYEEKKGNWRRAKTSYDDYDCWIDTKQISFITEEEFENLTSSHVVSELIHVLEKQGSSLITPIVIGSTLPNFKKNSVTFAEQEFSFDGQVTNTSKKNK